jgi:hypothetical protein
MRVKKQQGKESETVVRLREVVRSARTGAYGDAASQLNEALQSVQSALSAGTVDPEVLNKLKISLETLFLVQKQHDWVAVADLIEYELIGLLRRATSPPPR